MIVEREEFGFPELIQKARTPLKDAAVVNVTRYRNDLKKLGLSVQFWSGGRTKMNRVKQGYPKEHWIDAACVGESGETVRLDPHDPVLHIQATGRGSRQMCLMNKYGFPRTQPKSAKRVHGFQTGDMVKLIMVKGKYRGVYRGKVTVRTSGTFDLTASTTHKISASWKRFELLQHFDGYAYGFHRLPSSVLV